MESNGGVKMSKYWYFLDGMLSVFSFPFFSRYPEPSNPVDLTEDFKQPRPSDADAIASDWKNVGNDIQKAISKYEVERITGI